MLYQSCNAGLSHRRSPTSIRSTPSDSPSVSQMIADVLNDQSSSKSKASSLEFIAALDKSASCLNAQLIQSWESNGVKLEQRGAWKGGLGSRRAAMLAVYQEKVNQDNQRLKRVLNRLTKLRPGLIRPSIMTRLESSSLKDGVAGLLSSLSSSDLTQIAVALSPLETIESQVIDKTLSQFERLLLDRGVALSDEDEGMARRLLVSFVSATLKVNLRLSLLRLRQWHDVNRVAMEGAQQMNLQQSSDDNNGVWPRIDGCDDKADDKIKKQKRSRGEKEDPLLDERLYFLTTLEIDKIMESEKIQKGIVPGGKGGGVCRSYVARVSGRSGIASFSRSPVPLALAATSQGGPVLGDIMGRGLNVGAAGQSSFGLSVIQELSELEAADDEQASIRNKALPVVSKFVKTWTEDLESIHQFLLFAHIIEWERSNSEIEGDEIEADQGCAQAVKIDNSAFKKEEATRRLQVKIDAPCVELSLLRREARRRDRSFLDPILKPHQSFSMNKNYSSHAPHLWASTIGRPDKVEGFQLSMKFSSNPSAAACVVDLSEEQILELSKAVLQLVPYTILSPSSASSSSSPNPWLPSPSSPVQIRLAQPSVPSRASSSTTIEARWITHPPSSPSSSSSASPNSNIKFYDPYQMSQADVQSLVTVLDAVTPNSALSRSSGDINASPDPQQLTHRLSHYALSVGAIAALSFIALKAGVLKFSGLGSSGLLDTLTSLRGRGDQASIASVAVTNDREHCQEASKESSISNSK